MVGLWQWQSQPRLYHAYTMFVTALFYILFPFLIAVKLFFTDDISEIIAVFKYGPTLLSGIKLIIIIQKRDMILEILDILQQLDERNNTADVYRRRFEKAIKKVRNIIKMLIVVYYTSTICDYLLPLLNTERALMIVSWLPFDPTARRDVYHLVMLYQLIGTLLTATIMQSTDVFGASIYCIVGAHLNILGERIKALGKYSKIFKFSTTYRQKCGKQREIDEQLKKSELQLNDCIETYSMCIR